MSITNDYGCFEFTASSENTNDSVISNQARLSDENGVHIRVSMFFDGTNNNKFNTEGRLEHLKRLAGKEYNVEKARVYEDRVRLYKSGKDKKGEFIDDSYANDYSNVARLFKNYEKKPLNNKKATDCLYIEGIATTSDGDKIIGGDDDSIGAGFGAGKTGIPKKVEKGCVELAKLCKKIADGDSISKLTVDVFGFSRGAAAARHFIYEITKEKIEAYTATIEVPMEEGGGYKQIQIPEQPPFGVLGKELKNKEINFEGDLVISFAGLFDTVPAYMNKGDGGTKTLQLNAVDKARYALHLTAMDERRAKFALASMKQRGSAAIEKALPGVHCDIGGSYNPVVEETGKVIFSGSKKDMLAEMDYLIKDGWYERADQLNGVCSYIDTLKIGVFNRAYIETARPKIVKNEYSFISLLIMRDKAELNTNGVKFISDIEKENEIPKELKPANERLRAYVFENAEPMMFYTREELDKEIALIKMMNEPYDFSKENYVAEPMSTRVNQTGVIEHRMNNNNSEPVTALSQVLNADDYPRYPALQQKIRDHLALLKLRTKYFHTSHECSNLKLGTMFFDPYASSIRTKPSRKIV